MRRDSRFVILCLLFLLSGACGLTYQVLWLRLLALVFGVTVHAASTVLASFMAGLALGAVLAERLVARGAPLRVFAALEAGIALSALATPLLLDAATGAYRPLSAAFPDSLALLTIARFVCSAAVLLVPTVLMGATLPVLSHAALARASSPRLGALYAVNTTGALAGALLTGYVFIGGVGIQRTFLTAAAVNLLVAAGAWTLSRVSEETSADVTGSVTAATSGPAVSATVVIWVMAVAGFAALALEIVWFRVLVQFLPATTYAFTTMLATVLAGIAAGSAVAARHLARPRDWGAVLAYTQGATSLVVLLSLALLGASYSAGWSAVGLVPAAAAAILPASLLMGYAFPLALALWTRPDPAAGGAAGRARPVGQLYSANVLGGIAGAVASGFVLLPLLGSRRALITLAGLYLVSSLALLVPARRLRGAVVLAVLFAGAVRLVPDPFEAALARHGKGERIFWREEGVQTSVSIHTHAFRGWLMYLDGLHQASDAPEMVKLHRLIGHLPMVLHPEPRRALVVGLGGGATPGAVSQHDADVLVVELSDSVRKGAGFFTHVNYDLLARPNVRLRVDDGRNFLSLTGDRFDVATADLIQPVHAGAGNLYSREYFTLVKRALADGGLALQWIGHRPDTQYKLIMRTFLDVFPETTLWLDGQLMVGATRPLTLSPALVEAKRANAETRAALDEVGLDSFETLLSWYTAGPDELRRFVGAGPVLTDDRPLVEYHRSLPAGDRPVDVAGLRGDVAPRVRR